MLLQFKQDLLHLKSRWQRFDQYCSPDAPLSNPQLARGEAENVIPESRFEVMLHLGQIEVWTTSAFEKFSGIVEEVQAEIEQAS